MRYFCLTVVAAALASGQSLSPVWVAVGDGSQAMARIVVSRPQDCPAIQIDGAMYPMSLRQPMPQGLRPACEFAIPIGAKKASVNGQALALPHANPSRVIAIGDTGCRIKGDELQACNDLAEWPFAQVATQAAGEKPDLVIHVGDYLYREDPCPADKQAMCGGTPAGDNWEAWNADFFTPAAKLLTAAPWAFSRGNHEDCERSWRGWFYYLDPRPWNGTCKVFSPPYLVSLGTFELVMLDSASVSANTLNKEQAALYAAQLATLHPAHAWLADHHPFWGMRTDSAEGKPAPVSPTLAEAWQRASPSGIDLILSGHVHLFELFSYDHGRPTQLVAGDGGTNLAMALEGSMRGSAVHGVRVLAGESQRQFGYSLLTRHGKTWDLMLKNLVRTVLVDCTIPPGRASCQTPTAE
jgi:calcineurin-like phosphoesterase family protein